MHGHYSFKSTTSPRITLDQKPAVRFNGVVIDTAANRRSIMSVAKYRAYEREFGIKVPLSPPCKNVKETGGRLRPIGEATIQIPFLLLNLVIDVDFSILKDDLPSLLSNRDLIDYGLDVSLQGAHLHIGDFKQPLVLENYFFIFEWDASSIPYMLYTDRELRSIHRAFGHLSVSSLRKLLKKSSKELLDKSVKKNLKAIAKKCSTCSKHSPAPLRLKLTVGTDDPGFNLHVYVDTVFLNGRPLKHIVDEATHFSAAAILKSQSSHEIWKGILRLWVHTFLGPPKFLSFDQGSAYTFNEFKSYAEALGMKMRERPIETPGAIGVVEPYHGPLRAYFKKTRETLSGDQATDDEGVQMAVFSLNSTMGPKGLVPMLLVFGALPRPARTTPAPTQLVAQRAMEEAKQAASHEQAKRQVAFAVCHPSNPKAKEDSERLHALTSGSKVLV